MTPLATRRRARRRWRDAIVWLASDGGVYITGAVVPVDGGFLAP